MPGNKSHKLTNDPQEMLQAKHGEDAHKAQFTNFAHQISGNAPIDKGQVSGEQHREPDTQNHMKTTENRIME
ncbi:hypothetical protein ACFQ3W_14290 [Paenibacillus puldeungensis]|uniref:DUF4025 domain-containing protein n=1 Tax=Paenibacillus puldeungensis TaxID=696536 RepID=A0ABW3RZM9_9BACL